MSRRVKLQEGTKFRVMRQLEKNSDLVRRELTGELGISVGALNHCLRDLINKGLVTMTNFFHSKEKLGYVYMLTPSRVAEKFAITHRFLQRKIEELDLLKVQIDTLKQDLTKT